MILGLTMFVCNLVGGLAICKWGKNVERLIVALLAVYIFTVPLLDSIELHSIRVGVFAAEIVLFAGLFLATGRIARWWLIVATGAHLLAVVSHLMPLIVPEIYVWTSVAIRRFVWGVVSLSILWGAWEAWAHSMVSLGVETDGNPLEV